MKRLFWMTIWLTCIAFVMIGASIRKPVTSTSMPRRHCVGYTVLEAGKGVDCHGDTVKLVKRYGFYELAARYENISAR